MKTNTVAEIKHKRYLSWEEACLATSYVDATFHPTIVQCAHQSLSSTSTPELGMIPTRKKGTTTDSHISIYTSKLSQAKNSWVYQARREMEGWIAKLVSSTTELWTPTQDLAWISQHQHTQHKEASPSMLHSPLGYAFHSNSLQGVQRRKTIPSWSICEVPSYTRFIKLVQIQFHSKPFHTKEKICTHTADHNVNTTKPTSTHSVTEETNAQQHSRSKQQTTT